MNGFEVELTDQIQTFVATGNVTINADHQAGQYDYDGDGANNAEERAAGSCVWSANELCTLEGRLDIPPQSAVAESELDSTNSIVIIDDDFSNGVEGWNGNSSRPVRSADGALCITLPAGPAPVFDLLIYTDLFEMRQTRYSVQFDIRASSDTEATVTLTSINPPPRRSFLDEKVEDISQTWKSVVINFEHLEPGITNGVSMGLTTLVPPIETTWCIDNFRILEER